MTQQSTRTRTIHPNMEEIRVVQSILNKTRLADLATVNSTGSPSLVPVSFIFDGRHLYFSSRAHSTKCKNILHNNKVSLSIIGENSVVLIQGTANILGPLQTRLTPSLSRFFYEKYSRDRRLSYDSVLVQVRPLKFFLGRLGRRQRQVNFEICQSCNDVRSFSP
jgi:hypothetical protein